MHNRPVRSVLIERIEHLPSKEDDFYRPCKEGKTIRIEPLRIAITCFEMLNRKSNERQESQPLLRSPWLAPTNIDGPLENGLEPTPFRDGTTLELSFDLQRRGLLRRFNVVFQNVAQDGGFSRLDLNHKQRQQQYDEQGMQSSLMPIMNRIIRNKSQAVTQAGASGQSSSSSLMHHHSLQNGDLGFFSTARSQSMGNEIIERRRDQNLAINLRPYQRDQWDLHYKELLKFVQKHGHCHIPHTYKDNPSLFRWAKRQRYQYKRKLENKQSSMSDARQQKLDEIGFVWDLHTKVWNERFHDLVEYKTRNGNCSVPCRYDANPSLGLWVKYQRRQYKLFQSGKFSRLTPDRFQLLTNLGFTCDPPSQAENSNMNRKMPSQS